MEKYLEANTSTPMPNSPRLIRPNWPRSSKVFIEKANVRLLELAGTLQAYIYSFITTDSYNQEAAKALSVLQPVMVKAQHLGNVLFKGWLAKIKDQIDEVIAQDDLLRNTASTSRKPSNSASS